MSALLQKRPNWRAATKRRFVPKADIRNAANCAMLALPSKAPPAD